ncbi:MAG TPA: GDYXXLXY domain-containing protein [Allosphingosinicella sp.]|nr:GDYXXLXY domain-containing protein [Allosphingosinicella sp.]
MRKAIALATGLAVLAFVNFGIYQRERLMTDGRLVFLKLAPVDPRSLMQGDYMRLNFEVADRAFPRGPRSRLADGHIVVALDPNGIGHFRRFSDGRPPAPGEALLRYRVRAGQPNFATNAYFFEEGQAETYAGAAYGEFRVGEDGEMILTGLRDSRLRPLRARRPLAEGAAAR